MASFRKTTSQRQEHNRRDGLWLSGYASSRRVALGTACERRVEEQEEVLSQVFERNLHDIPCACQPGMSVANGAFGLEAPSP
jgi:hypothetical protein